MEPIRQPRPQFMAPDKKRPRPIDEDDQPDPDDVDADDNAAHDEAFDKWWNDDTGKIQAPLAPAEQPEIGLHVPNPEMDETDEKSQEAFRKQRQSELDKYNRNNGRRSV